MKLTPKVTYNTANINRIESDIRKALIKTADAVKTDLQQSQTMPFDTGQLQNRSTFVDDSEVDSGKVFVVSDTPYARRLYFHPEYKFSTRDNPNAGAGWFEPYINGTKKDYAKKVFAVFMRKSLGG
ncbi:MAG: hypothetical protein IKK37_03515 [Clostridia bacterium]|nr:hypothetical protein [Clostridia bacterium]